MMPGFTILLPETLRILSNGVFRIINCPADLQDQPGDCCWPFCTWLMLHQYLELLFWDSPYYGLPQMYTNVTAVDPNISPSLNTSIEAGFDVSFLENRVGFSFTYFNETRDNEIIAVDMSTATGYTGYLTNAGSAQRSGIEMTLSVFSGGLVYGKNGCWKIEQ